MKIKLTSYFSTCPIARAHFPHCRNTPWTLLSHLWPICWDCVQTVELVENSSEHLMSARTQGSPHQSSCLPHQQDPWVNKSLLTLCEILRSYAGSMTPKLCLPQKGEKAAFAIETPSIYWPWCQTSSLTNVLLYCVWK